MPSRRTRVRVTVPVAVLVAALLAGVGTAPARAGVLTGTYLQGQGSATVSGLTRARLTVHAGTGLSGASLGATLAFRNASGSATATEELFLDGGTVSCGPRLGTCTIDDAGGLGIYGRIKLTFAATGPRVKRSLVCFGSDTVFGTSVSRKGVLTGTLQVETRSKKLGAIRNSGAGHRVPASIPFTMVRSTYNGAGCPTTEASCPERVYLATGDFRLQADRRYTGAKRGTTYFSRDLPSVEPDVTRSIDVSSKGSGAEALTVQTKATLANVSVGLVISSPFVTGSLALTDPTDPAPGGWFGCDAMERNGTLTGTLTWRTPGRAKKVEQVSAGATVNHILGTVLP